jgi:hypothetical protein
VAGSASSSAETERHHTEDCGGSDEAKGHFVSVLRSFGCDFLILKSII